MKEKNLVIRELRSLDLLKLHKMYVSLSNESKRFFHPFSEPRFTNPRYLLAQVALFLSCIRVLRKLLVKVLPHFVFISLVAVNTLNNEVIGFAFIRLINRLHGELGIGIQDAYQGRGIGSKLIDSLIKLAKKERLKEVSLIVLVGNYKAIRFYEKIGFKKIGLIKGYDFYHGQRYDCIKMLLNIV